MKSKAKKDKSAKGSIKKRSQIKHKQEKQAYEMDKDEWSASSDDDFDGSNIEEKNSMQPKWFDEFDEGSEDEPLDEFSYNTLRREAGAIFEKEVASNSGKQPKTIPRSDYAWMKTVIHKGTVSDKIAAYVLLIQDDPIVNLANLKHLVSMVKVGKKRECFTAMDTLVELFLDSLLPPNRKLKYFVQNPLSKINKITSNNGDRRRRLLLLWFFEEQLKTQYMSFLAALNDAAHDSVDANKERAIAVMNKLLRGHPEQEATLLSNIVNKLGDPSHKIGSKVIYTLTQLLDTHSAMKGVVMEEVEKAIFRPNMSKRAQYYSVCFLSQFSLESSDKQLASNLISIYFALFKACIKKGEIDSRMMGSLLTGVSRAYPYATSECTVLKDHINTVYKVVHLSGSNVSIHALSILSLVDGASLSNRFMMALYKKIGDPSMYQAAHHAMFMSLIFKTLKRDTEDSRVCAFIKRLFQVCVHLSVPLICGLLMIISQVIYGRKNFSLRMETESLPVLKLEDDDDDDGEEIYKDQPLDEVKPAVADSEPESNVSSWFHAKIQSGHARPPIAHGNYDPYQRNPQHAEGASALPIELVELSRHYHPTVALFATNILAGNKISYSGDPLQDFTLIRFLDKFVFKNPKQINPTSQQVTTFARFSRKKFYSSVGIKRMRANTTEYLNNAENVIPVDETFLYKYLKKKEAERVKPKKVKNVSVHEDSDVESVGDEEFDNILNRVASGEKDDLDFMDEIGSLPTNKSKRTNDTETMEENDDDEFEGEMNDSGTDEDEEDDWSDNEAESDMESNAEDFDGDELDDLSDGDELATDDEHDTPKANNKTKIAMKKKKTSGLFASAEEFADLLENDDHYMSGTSGAVSRKDNAALKQLNWEAERNNWSRGGHHFKKSKPFKNDKEEKRNKRKISPPNKKIFKKRKTY